MKPRKLLSRIASGSLANVRFADLCRLAEAMGWELRRINGSHHVFGGRDMKDYHINIFFSDEDGGYIADIPDLDACSAFGETPEEALAEVESAKEAWLAVARETGKPVPPPRYRPAIYQTGG